MKHLVAMDPGLRDCWVSIFRDGYLLETIRVKNPEKKARGPVAWLEMGRAFCEIFEGKPYINALVTEIPQVYNVGKQKGDQDDITNLSGIVGAVTMALNPTSVTSYYPREWKGQLPKDVCGDRVLLTLSESERKAVGNYGALQHNILDSIGIGLKYLGRFNVGVSKSLTVGDIMKRLEERTSPKNVDFKELG